MDKERIENAVREILLAIGEDPSREGLRETPRRVANMYAEVFGGMEQDPRQFLKVFSETECIPCASTICCPLWEKRISYTSPPRGR